MNKFFKILQHKKKLIIFTHGGGRFANQLILYGHLIAFIEEYREEFELLNLSFWDYSANLIESELFKSRIYPTDQISGRIVYLLYHLYNCIKSIKKIPKLQVWIIRILHFFCHINPCFQSISTSSCVFRYLPSKKVKSFDLNASSNVHDLKKRKISAIAGWEVRSWNLFQKHQNHIRNALKLNPRYYIPAEKFINSLKKEYDFLIGLLIRQDDYRQMWNGKYFFSTSQYLHWINQAKVKFANKGKIGFVIASDERQDSSLFKNLSCHFATGIMGGEGHYIESLIELSLCDTIMTAPSTFSVWASFLGNVPLLPLISYNQIIEKEDLLMNSIFDAIKHPNLSDSVS